MGRVKGDPLWCRACLLGTGSGAPGWLLFFFPAADGFFLALGFRGNPWRAEPSQKKMNGERKKNKKRRGWWYVKSSWVFLPHLFSFPPSPSLYLRLRDILARRREAEVLCCVCVLRSMCEVWDTDMSDLPVTPVCVRVNEWKHESSDRRASSNRPLAGRKMSRNMWRVNMLFIHAHFCLLHTYTLPHVCFKWSTWPHSNHVGGMGTSTQGLEVTVKFAQECGKWGLICNIMSIRPVECSSEQPDQGAVSDLRNIVDI